MRLPLLRELLPACATALGVEPGDPGLVPASRKVVVLLVDGMGYLNLRDSGLDLEAIEWLLQAPPGLTSVPSTTPVALATLGTGLAPSHHGFVGATFEVPELGCFLRPLKWHDQPDPTAVQPDPTWFERIVDSGLRVTRIGPAAYADSGLTRAVLRGGAHLPAESLADLVEAVLDSVHDSELVYAYHPKLDKLGHVHGVASDEWRAELAAVAEAVAQLRLRLPSDATLVVTADHGMVDAGTRVWLEDRPGLLSGITGIAGEPRLRHVYCDEAERSRVLRNWRAVEDVADVYSREDFIETFWQGEVDDFALDRVGAVVAVTRGTALLASRNFDSKVSSLRGQHGSTSDVECQIPIAVLAG